MRTSCLRTRVRAHGYREALAAVLVAVHTLKVLFDDVAPEGEAVVVADGDGWPPQSLNMNNTVAPAGPATSGP